MSDYLTLFEENEEELQNNENKGLLVEEQPPASTETETQPASVLREDEGASPSLYTDLFRQNETEGTRARAGIKAGSAMGGDRAAEVINLSKQSGLNRDLVERNLDEVRARQAEAELDKSAEEATKSATGTALWMSGDQYNAALADGDLGILSDIERGIVRAGDAIFSQNTGNATLRKVYERRLGLYEALFGADFEYYARDDALREAAIKSGQKPDASLSEQVSGFLAENVNIWSPGRVLREGITGLVREGEELLFDRPEQTNLEYVRSQIKPLEDEIKALANTAPRGSLEYYVPEMIAGAADLVPNVVSKILLGPAGTSVALGEIGTRVYGLSFNEGFREKGLSVQRAHDRAMTMALFEAITEKIPLEQMTKGLAAGKRGLTKRTINVLTSMGLEGFQEVLVEMLNMGYDMGFLGEDINPKEARQNLVDAFVIGAGASGQISVATNVVGAVVERRQASAARERTASQLDRARESVLRTRSPEHFEEYYQTLSNQNDRPTIGIDVEPVIDYLTQQGEDPGEFFQLLGVEEATARNAYEMGVDIDVEAGKFFTVMPDNPYRDIVLMNVRETEAAPTMAQAEIRTEQMRERIDQAYEELTSADRKEVEDASKRLRNQFVEDAVAAGRARSEAINQAAVYEAYFRTTIDAFANDPNRTRPLAEVVNELERDVFNIRARSVPFAERGEPLEQTPQQQRQRFRDTLSDDVVEKVVTAANDEATDRIDSSFELDFLKTFDIDQIIRDELNLAVEQDGFERYGELLATDVIPPMYAATGDRIPIESAIGNAILYFPDGSQRESWKEDAKDDFEIDIVNLERNPDGTVNNDESFFEVVPKNINEMARRYADDSIAESQVGTIEDALNHPDHQVRSKAFGTLLDELNIDYYTDGSTLHSFYYYVGTGTYDPDLEEYTEVIKIRFADHGRQSNNHATSDFNVYDNGYDTAIDAITFILRDRRMIDPQETFQETVDPTSENFRNWFRDSAVVDENGEPLVVYHASPAGVIDEFKDVDGKNRPASKVAGHYFATYRFDADDQMFLGDSGAITEAYIRLENPIDLNNNNPLPPDAADLVLPLLEEVGPKQWAKGKLKEALEGTASLNRVLNNSGVDGRKQRDLYKQFGFDGLKDGRERAVFDPTQIKSVFNRGTFDTSENFRNWFRDSAVVDENGEPLVLYRGIGEEVNPELPQSLGPMTWLTNDKGDALDYQPNQILSVYASIQNPADLDNSEVAEILEELEINPDDLFELTSNELAVTTLKEFGFDGIMVRRDDLGSFDGDEVIHYAVFDDAQIKSVDNRGTFDPDDPRILFQDGPDRAARLAVAQARLRDEPESLGLSPELAQKVNNIYRPETLPTERLPSNREAALWLESQFIGEPITDMTQELADDQIEEIAKILAAEVQLGLETSGSAFDWYTSAIERAINIIKIKYPMVTDDTAAAEAGFGTSENARFVLTYIMSVTSQNLDVAANTVATDKAFEQMIERVKNGIYSMPREWGTGDKQEAMGDNFDKFGPMIEAMPGNTFPEKIEALNRIFRRSMTVKEWVKYMDEEGIPYTPPGQTAVDAVVYGSSALGPKIGNGFWQNLNGNFDPLTIDLWLRRTWGRLTGASIGNPGALPAQRQRLKDSIKRSRSRSHRDPDHIAQAINRITELENIIKTRDLTSFVEDLVNEIATIDEDVYTEEARLELEALNVETFTRPILEQIEALNPDDFDDRKALNEAKAELREKAKRAKAIYADEKTRIRDDIKQAKIDFREEKQRLRGELRDRKAAFVQDGKRLKVELEIATETVPDLRNIKAPEAYRKEYDDSPEELLEYAKRILSVWDAEYKRLRETSNTGQVSADLQPTWARAAKTIVTNLAKPLDQVANGTQRKQIEKAGTRALDILEEAGVPIKTADMQAVVWYPEKDLWGALTSELATDEDGLPVVPPSGLNESYDTAFARTLRSQGYEVEGVDGYREGGDGARAVAGQDARPQEPEGAEGVGAFSGEVRGRGSEELYQTVDPPTGIGRLYSQAQRATQSLPQQKATASQWLSHFKKSGVKDDELDFVVGLQEFLNSQKTIDKDDLLAFIEQRGIKLDEVELGGPDTERQASLEAAGENLDQARELSRLEYKNLSSALRVVDPEMRGGEYADPIIGTVNTRGPSYVQKFEDKIPGIFEKAQNYYKAYQNVDRAYEKYVAELQKYEDAQNLPARFERYTAPGEKISPDREFYLTLPADLTEGNADIEDWLQPRGHRIDDPVADERLVVRIRANGRELEDGRRVLFIEEMQDDRGQAAREEGVRKRIPDLEERRFAYRNADSAAQRVMAYHFGGLSELPMNERFNYLDRLVDRAARVEIDDGDRWVTSQATGDGRRSYADFDYTAEDIAVVDRLIELKRSEPEEVTSDYGDLLLLTRVPDRPFLGSNKVVPLALKRMMIQATENGDDAIAWTSGEMQTERYRLSNVVSSIEVLEVNEDEAFVVVNQRGGGPIALPGVQTEVEYLGDDYDTLAEIIRDFRGSIVNTVPRNKLPEFFGKDLADKMIKGGRMQIYEKLDLDIGGAGMKKFYNKIAVNAANKIGKKYKAKTEVGQLDEQDVWVLPLTDQLKETILGEGLPMMQAAKDDPMGSFDPVRRVISLFEKSNYSTLLHESGHAYVDMLEQLAQRDDAPARLKENYDAMLDWVGATSSADLDIRINGEPAREKQERLARAFEAYLREGKAPSSKLQSAFDQFRLWLRKIYENLLDLNVQMNPEITQVFDRMLATDQEIDEMMAVNEFTIEDSPSILSLLDAEQRVAAQDLQLQARDRVREMRNIEQERHAASLESEAYNEERTGVSLEVRAEVEAEQDFRSHIYLTTGEYNDRETPEALQGRRISRKAMLDAGYTKEQLEAIPRASENGKSGKAVYSSNEEDATDPEFLAGFLGYDSGADLMAAMIELPAREDEINRRTDAIMGDRPQYRDPASDGTLLEMSKEFAYNAEQAKLIDLELDALAKKAGMERDSRAFVQAVADRMFREEQVGDMLSPTKFALASRRAARRAEQAAAKGNWQKALVEKRKEQLNFELHRRAIKANKEVSSINKRLKFLKTKKYSPKQIDPRYSAEMQALLQFYEFGQKSKSDKMDGQVAQRVADFIAARQLEGANLILPGDLIEVASMDPETQQPRYVFKTKFWKEMTLAELRALRDMAENLRKIGADQSGETKAAKKAFGEGLAENINSATARRTDVRDPMKPAPYDKIKKLVKKGSFAAAHRKMESMLLQLDGFKALGPMYRAVFNALADASDTKAFLVTEVMKRMNENLNIYDPGDRGNFSNDRGRVAIAALGGARLTREERVTTALNWGNATSREAVLEDQSKINDYGQAWNETAINEILSTLDAKDLDFIEATWKLIDSFWEDYTLPNGRVVQGIKSLETETAGFSPPKVEPDPFFINGRMMSGGYYPLMYDPLSDERSAKESEAELKKRLESGGFARAATSHGFTNARVGSGGRTVRKDLSALNRHLDEVTQDISYRKAVIQAAEVLGNNDVRAAIKGTMGEPYLQALNDILVYTATGGMATNDMGPVDNFMASARINVTVGIMGFNFRSIFTQPMGLNQSILRIGLKNVANGVAWFWAKPSQIPQRIKQINDLSPYMAERANTMTRELDDLSNQIQNKTKLKNIKQFGFVPMVFVDVVSVAYPTWWGAYDSALAGKVDGIDASDQVSAVRYADMQVRTTQGSGGAQNLSMVQQRNELMKLMTMFYGYFNTTYNLQAEAWAKARADGSSVPRALLKKEFIGSTILLQTIPAILADLLLEKWPDPEEEDEDPYYSWAKWMLVSQVKYSSAQLVGVRDVVSGVVSGFDLSLTPATAPGEGFGKLLNMLGKPIATGAEEGFSAALEEAGEVVTSPRFVKKFVSTAGMAAGIPGSNGIARSADYLYKFLTDELKKDPRNVLEFTQGLLLTGDR